MAHNRFSFIGNLTKPPELRQTRGSKTFANISIAVNRVVGSGADRTERPDFFRITLWEKQAENADRYLGTGSKVYVEGRIESGKYDKDGQTHYATHFIAEQIEYLGGGPQGKGTADSAPKAAGEVSGNAVDEDLSAGFKG